MMACIDLSPSEIESLIALHVVAPATLKVINVTRRIKFGSHAPVTRLLRKGLISRRKSPAPEPLTEWERIEGKQMRLGKRPYIYDLTPVGRTVAHHLHAVSTSLGTLNIEKERMNAGQMRM